MLEPLLIAAAAGAAGAIAGAAVALAWAIRILAHDPDPHPPRIPRRTTAGQQLRLRREDIRERWAVKDTPTRADTNRQERQHRREEDIS